MIPVITGIINRYSFLENTPPEKFFGPEKKNLELKIGTFFTEDNTPIEVSLTVHHDGLVAETKTSTKDSDRFLEDTFAFLGDEFGLAPYRELPIHRKYLSEVYFTLSQAPEFFSKLTNSFVKKSSSYIDRDKVGDFQFRGFHLATDPDLSRNPLFIRLEREVDVPIRENRFFSSSSLETCEHIKLLEELESESH